MVFSSTIFLFGFLPITLAGYYLIRPGLRNAFLDHARRYGWEVFIPKFGYTTDNAAMIAMVGTYKFRDKDFCPMEAPAYARTSI